jgi:chromosome segregation ATPase
MGRVGVVTGHQAQGQTGQPGQTGQQGQQGQGQQDQQPDCDKETDPLKKKLCELQKSLNGFNEKIKNTKHNIVGEQKDLSNWDAKVKSLTAEFTATQKEMDSRDSLAKAAKADEQANKDELAEDENAVKALKKPSEDRRRTIEDIIDYVDDEIANAEETRNASETALKDKETALVAAKAKLKDAQADLQKIQSYISNFPAWMKSERQKLADLRGQIQRAVDAGRDDEAWWHAVDLQNEAYDFSEAISDQGIADKQAELLKNDKAVNDPNPKCGALAAVDKATKERDTARDKLANDDATWKSKKQNRDQDIKTEIGKLPPDPDGGGGGTGTATVTAAPVMAATP